jgi:hypothetical protein
VGEGVRKKAEQQGGEKGTEPKYDGAWGVRHLFCDAAGWYGNEDAHETRFRIQDGGCGAGSRISAVVFRKRTSFSKRMDFWAAYAFPPFDALSVAREAMFTVLFQQRSVCSILCAY